MAESEAYKTIEHKAFYEFVEQKSRFIGWAMPVASEVAAKVQLEQYRKTYHDARHICYAYVLGHNKVLSRFNDDGEPSGTAGLPILAQIHGADLTNVLVLVVRYFGGIKLGTGGLVSAYKRASKEALANTAIITEVVQQTLCFTFDYGYTNSVLYLLSKWSHMLVEETYTEHCRIIVRIATGDVAEFSQQLQTIKTVCLIDLLAP